MKRVSIKCCGEPMKVKMETPMYFEAECKKCGDIIFLKKEKTFRPQLIDD